MSHNHDVIDTDVHYKIDGLTRTVININETKRELVQNDHNSERFTFEIPRYVDGHDFSECNAVQVHYENTDAFDKNVSKGVYDVDDLHIKSDDDKFVVLSWLIHGNATKYVGTLNFTIRFACVNEEGKVEYAWNTTIFKGISILPGLFNDSNEIVKQEPDIIAGLITRVKNAEKASTVPIKESGEQLTIEPVPNTEISEVISWMKYDPVELADTVNWKNFNNWVIVNQGEGEYSSSWLQYLVIPTEGGIFDFEGMVGSWGADVNSVYIGSVAKDGTLFNAQMCQLDCDEFGNFSYYGFEWGPSGDEAHAIAIVIDSCCPSGFLLEFSCLLDKNTYFYYGQEVKLTVVKDGVETTYSADTPCIDWNPNWSYNWLTGQLYDEGGNLLEDEYGSYRGNAYPELVNIGKATFKPQLGTVSVGYVGYPAKSIAALNKENDKLQNQLTKQQATIDRIVDIGGFGGY